MGILKAIYDKLTQFAHLQPHWLTRLATALGNFEQGSIEAESAIVAQWLTSGLRVAMARTGWHLLSPRLMLTKVPECVLHDYYHKGYPLTRNPFGSRS